MERTKRSIYDNAKNGKNKNEKHSPTVGLEPTTTRLRALRSTD